MFTYPIMAGGVIGAGVSVEEITGTVSIPGGDSTTIALTKGQIAANCVPWISCRVPDAVASPENDCHLALLRVNIWDDGGTAKVTLDRYPAAAGGPIEFVLTVVEFGPDIRVQKIDVQPPALTSTDWTETTLSVDQTKSFVLLNLYADSVGAGSQLAGNARHVAVTWSSNTLLRFQRQGTIATWGGVAGYAYVVEDLVGTHFSVSTASHTFTAASSNKTITAVAAVDKTMLLVTQSSDNGNDQPYWHNAVAGLVNSTTITARKGDAASNTIAEYQIVEWLDDGVLVQHGLESRVVVTGTPTNTTFSVAIPTPVDSTKSIAVWTAAQLAHADTAPTANVGNHGVFGKMTISLDTDGENWTAAYLAVPTFTGTCNMYWQVITFDTP